MVEHRNVTSYFVYYSKLLYKCMDIKCLCDSLNFSALSGNSIKAFSAKRTLMWNQLAVETNCNHFFIYFVLVIFYSKIVTRRGSGGFGGPNAGQGEAAVERK